MKRGKDAKKKKKRQREKKKKNTLLEFDGIPRRARGWWGGAKYRTRRRETWASSSLERKIARGKQRGRGRRCLQRDYDERNSRDERPADKKDVQGPK